MTDFKDPQDFKLKVLDTLKHDFSKLLSNFPYSFLIKKLPEFYFIVRESKWLGRFPWIDEDELSKSSDKSNVEKSFFSRDFWFLFFGLHFVTGLFYFIYKYFSYLPYRALRTTPSRVKLLLVQPAFNLVEFETGEGEVNVGYWGNIKPHLREMVTSLPILLLPYTYSEFPSHKAVARKLSEINSQKNYQMLTIGAYFGFFVLIRSAFQFSVLSFCTWFYCIIQLMKVLWNRSDSKLAFNYGYLSGMNLASALLNSNLIDASIESFTQIDSAIYICEGQSWELTLVRRLKCKSQTTQVSGYIHVPYRERDTTMLNYLITSRIGPDLVMPDYFLCPGPSTIEAMKGIGIKPDQVIPVEATRFETSRAKHYEIDLESNSLLLVADINLTQTMEILDLLNQVAAKQGVLLKVYVQLHPTQTDLNLKWISKNLDICILTSLPLNPLVIRLVIFGGMTTAFLQTEFTNLPALFYHKTQLLKYPPSTSELLQDRVFSSLDELKEAIFDGAPRIEEAFRNKYLFLDSNYPRWRSALSHLLK